MPLDYQRTLSLRLNEKAGNHEEFQLRVDYIGFWRKARIFLFSFSLLINFLAIWENLPGAGGVFGRALRRSIDFVRITTFVV
jgi:hypothetical protein